MRNSSWKISSTSATTLQLDRHKQINRSQHTINDFYLTSIGKLRRQNTLEKRLRPASLGLENPKPQTSVLDHLRDKPSAHFKQTAVFVKPIAELDRCFASLAETAARLSGIRYELSVSMKQALEDAHIQVAAIMAACFEQADSKEKTHSKQLATLRNSLTAAERDADEWHERSRGFERSIEIYHLEVDSYRVTVDHLKKEITYLNEHNKQIVAALGREDLPNKREDIREKIADIKQQSSAIDSMIDRLMADDARIDFYSSYKSVLSHMQSSSVDRSTQTPSQLTVTEQQLQHPDSVVDRFVHRLAEEGIHVLPQSLVEAAVLDIFRFVASEMDSSVSMEEYLCMFFIRRTHNLRLATINVAQMIASLRCYPDSCRCRLLLRLLDNPAIDHLLTIDTCLSLAAAAAPHTVVSVAAVRHLLERLAVFTPEQSSLDVDQLSLMAVEAHLAESKSVLAAIKSKLKLDSSIDQIKAAAASVDSRFRALPIDRCLLLTFLDKHDLDLDCFLLHLSRVRLFKADTPAPQAADQDKPQLPNEAPHLSGASPRQPLERQEDESKQLLDAASAIFAHHYSIIRSVRQYLQEFGRQAREDLEAKELFKLVADLSTAVESASQYLSYPIHL